ncbi:MAG: hypothetical protein Q8K75_07400 [Chlamydiales bacterium]|nr:hypothetical protein [Chlamydiales bacterium]
MATLAAETELFEQTLQEFQSISNEEAYVKIFSQRMMKPVPGKNCEFFGCNHRIDMLPFVQRLVKNLPTDAHIFDVGAGAGDVVNFALKDAPVGTVINIEEPNCSLLESYVEKVATHDHLRLGIAYNGYLQDYYQGTKAVLPSPPQNLILAMHMIYHLTDFTCQNITPEEDLLDALSFLYDILAPGGSILVAYADLLENSQGAAVCSAAEKYFREVYPKECYADNLISIYKARNDLLAPNGSVVQHLAQRFPKTKPALKSEWRMCHFFGESIADLGVLALATELCSSDEQLFDLNKLQFCFDYISHQGELIGLQKEEGNVVQKGLWRANEPHVISVITKGMC